MAKWTDAAKARAEIAVLPSVATPVRVYAMGRDVERALALLERARAFVHGYRQLISPPNQASATKWLRELDQEDEQK